MSLESDLRALEARVYALPVASLEERVAALEQQMQQVWSLTGLGACVVQYAITVEAAATGSKLGGATVSLANAAGVVVCSGTTNTAGVFLATVYTDDPLVASVAATGYASAAVALPAATCGDSYAATVALAPPPPSGPYSYQCRRYLAGTMTLSGTKFGSAYLTWNAASAGYFGSGQFVVPAGSPCSAGETIPIAWQVLWETNAPTLNMSVYVPTGATCPAPGTVGQCSTVDTVSYSGGDGSAPETVQSCGSGGSGYKMYLQIGAVTSSRYFGTMPTIVYLTET